MSEITKKQAIHKLSEEYNLTPEEMEVAANIGTELIKNYLDGIINGIKTDINPIGLSQTEELEE